MKQRIDTGITCLRKAKLSTTGGRSNPAIRGGFARLRGGFSESMAPALLSAVQKPAFSSVTPVTLPSQGRLLPLGILGRPAKSF
jgi:hypothetical protein